MYIMHVQAPIMNNRVENKGLFRKESNSNRLGGKPYEAFTIGVSIDFCGTNLKLAADLPYVLPLNNHININKETMKSVEYYNNSDSSYFCGCS